VVAGRRPNFGFKYNANRDNYVVDEVQMGIIRRIFREVGRIGPLMSSACASPRYLLVPVRSLGGPPQAPAGTETSMFTQPHRRGVLRSSYPTLGE